MAALALFGVSNDLASSYAIAFHGTTFLPIILLGAWSLARTPVALSDLRGVRQSVSVHAVEVAGHAKANLFLRVLAREADGYPRHRDAVLPAGSGGHAAGRAAGGTRASRSR